MNAVPVVPPAMAATTVEAMGAGVAVTVTRTVKVVVAATTVTAAAITQGHLGAIQNVEVLMSDPVAVGTVLPVAVAPGPVVDALLDPVLAVNALVAIVLVASVPVASVPAACVRALAVASVALSQATVDRRAAASHPVGKVTPGPVRGAFVTAPIGSRIGIGTVARIVSPSGGSPAMSVHRRGVATRHPLVARTVSNAPLQRCNRRQPLPHRPPTI